VGLLKITGMYAERDLGIVVRRGLQNHCRGCRGNGSALIPARGHARVSIGMHDSIDHDGTCFFLLTDAKHMECHRLATQLTGIGTALRISKGCP